MEVTGGKSDASATMMDYSQPIAASDLFRLNHRTILVTGGAGALGVTLVGALLEYGADVVCTDMRSEPSKEEWDSLLATAHYHNCLLTYHQLNVTDEASVDALMSLVSTQSRFPLRGLVSCAGISERYPAEAYPLASFRRILDTNITGSFLCARAAARSFHERSVAGSIILIASMSGSVVNQGVTTAAYNTSKSALLQLARSLAAEWGGNPIGLDGLGQVGGKVAGKVSKPPIRVNTLSPGYIRTEATAPTLRAIEGIEALWTGHSMLGRLAWAHEFRAPVLFLLGDGSCFVTGTDLKVDGGHTGW